MGTFWTRCIQYWWRLRDGPPPPQGTTYADQRSRAFRTGKLRGLNTLAVQVDAERVRIYDPVDAWQASVRWDEISEVVTYKEDLWAGDLICVELRINEETTALFLHEQMVGFESLFDTLETQFPGLNPRWYFEVMLPPFEANYTVLWSRPVS